MGEYYEEDDRGNIYGWMIYLAAAFLLIACVVKYMQIDLYAL